MRIIERKNSLVSSFTKNCNTVSIFDQKKQSCLKINISYLNQKMTYKVTRCMSRQSEIVLIGDIMTRRNHRKISGRSTRQNTRHPAGHALYKCSTQGFEPVVSIIRMGALRCWICLTKIIEPKPDSNLEHSVCISLKFESWTLESVCPSDSEIMKRIRNKCGYIRKS